MPSSIFDTGLDRNAANFAALSPLGFLERAASVFPDLPAVVHGLGERCVRRSWAQLYARCRQLADVLRQRGLGRGDTVAVMLANTPEMVEAHFGIPMAGCVLNAINTRLDAAAVAFMLEHGEAKLFIVDREFAAIARSALAQCARPIEVIDVLDPLYDGPGEAVGMLDYEAWIARGDAQAAWSPPADEWDAIALNYTSGTTGNPKGVVYHHRGAYLNAVSNILVWAMPQHPVYLWTLPMFHCNGWCFPWTIAAMAGTHVCLRKVDAALIFDLIRAHRVTHYCGAPIVHTLLINARRRASRASSTRSARCRRGCAAGGDDRGHGPARHRPHARLWADRGLRAGHRVCEAAGLGAPVGRRARRPQWPTRCALPDGGVGQGARSRHAGRGAARRTDDRRGDVPRQHHHARLPEEPSGDRRRIRRRLVPLG